MDQIREFAEQVLRSQSFSRLLGTELRSVGVGTVELVVPIADHGKQQHGFAHGGLISYLADNALTFAGGTALGGNALTAEFKINYIRPGIGERLVAKAVSKHAGKRQAVCQCEIYVETGETQRLCALAQGTIVAAD